MLSYLHEPTYAIHKKLEAKVYFYISCNIFRLLFNNRRKRGASRQSRKSPQSRLPRSRELRPAKFRLLVSRRRRCKLLRTEGDPHLDRRRRAERRRQIKRRIGGRNVVGKFDVGHRLVVDDNVGLGGQNGRVRASKRYDVNVDRCVAVQAKVTEVPDTTSRCFDAGDHDGDAGRCWNVHLCSFERQEPFSCCARHSR